MANQYFPDDDNGYVLRRLADRGVDLTIPRNIEFAVVFEEAAQALAFHGVMQRAGYSCELSPPHADVAGYDVIVTIAMAPTHAGITAMEDELAAASDALGGRNDGWGFLDEPVQLLS